MQIWRQREGGRLCHHHDHTEGPPHVAPNYLPPTTSRLPPGCGHFLPPLISAASLALAPVAPGPNRLPHPIRSSVNKKIRKLPPLSCPCLCSLLPLMGSLLRVPTALSPGLATWALHSHLPFSCTVNLSSTRFTFFDVLCQRLKDESPRADVQGLSQPATPHASWAALQEPPHLQSLPTPSLQHQPGPPFSSKCSSSPSRTRVLALRSSLPSLGRRSGEEPPLRCPHGI